LFVKVVLGGLGWLLPLLLLAPAPPVCAAALASRPASRRQKVEKPAEAKREKREKRNKYAQFSKADEVRRSLRFSNIEDEDAESGSAAISSLPPLAPRERDKWTYPDAAEVDQRDPTTFGFTEIGMVLGAHGTRGELKVMSDSDFAVERLCRAGPTWLRRKRRRAPREDRVLHGRKGPGVNIFLVTLESVSSRESAAALKGATLHVRRELRPSLDEGEVMLW